MHAIGYCHTDYNYNANNALSYKPAHSLSSLTYKKEKKDGQALCNKRHLVSKVHHIITFSMVIFLVEMNRCQPNPCHNLGMCNEVNGDFECACPAEYMGRDCQGKHI